MANKGTSPMRRIPTGTVESAMNRMEELLTSIENYKGELSITEEDEDEYVKPERIHQLERRLEETEKKNAQIASLLDVAIVRLKILETNSPTPIQGSSTDQLLIQQLRTEMKHKDTLISQMEQQIQKQEDQFKKILNNIEDLVRRVIGEVRAVGDVSKEMEYFSPPSVRIQDPQKTTAQENTVQYPKGYNPYARRFSVSDESRHPEQDSQLEKLKIIPKSGETRNRIRHVILQNILFKKLDEEQIERCLDVMFEKRLKAGEVIIRQGASGDNFYIIDQGNFDVIKDGLKVNSVGPGRSFGELALMYNAPRNATVQATTDSLCWAMDRTAFRSILMDYTIKKRTEYEKFLSNVPILSNLTAYERAIIADALEPFDFEDGDMIIKQGEQGDIFYIIEKGEAIVTQSRSTLGEDIGKPVEITRVTRGDYFGEVALLTNKPRAANVISVGPVRCLGMNRKDFIQLMGPCDKILQRNMENYKSYEEIEKIRVSGLGNNQVSSLSKKKRSRKRNKKQQM